MIMQILIFSEQDGILCSILQDSSYSVSIALHGGILVTYYLIESSGWSLEISKLKQHLDVAQTSRTRVCALVVINPRNPKSS